MEDNWISVEDRLPEITPKFWDAEMGIWITPLSIQILLCDEEDVFEGSYHHNGKFSSWFMNEVFPTHWQPLPKPPKQIKQ